MFVLLFSAHAVLAQSKGDSCESASLKLDLIRNAFSNAATDQKVILIGRTGVEKPSDWNERRLHAVREYLLFNGVPTEYIVSAVGKPTAKVGQVEVYLFGKLADIIFAGPNAEIPVGSCDHDGEDRRLFQLKKTKQRRSK